MQVTDTIIPRLQWYAMHAPDVMAVLGVTDRGLRSDEASGRLVRFGVNAVPRAAPASALRVLAGQFRSVVTLLLVAGCVIAGVTGDLADAVAIAAVLVLNVGLGFGVEIRAHRAVEALTRLEARVATVLRDGLPREIDARELVPGDLLLLEAGQSVPADARLLTSTELRVVESTLTGESLPVAKRADVQVEAGAVLPDRRNMVFAGTMIATGTARALVVATGAATELGTIGRLVNATEVLTTPLEQRLDALGRQLVWIAVAVGAVTGFIAWLQHASASLVLQTAIALAVAAVPEGLPAVATITLALGVRRMAKRNALIRRLPSVETLGSVTVICTDKTGTLTAGAMAVTEIRTLARAYAVTGAGYEPAGTFVRDGRTIAPSKEPDLLLALRIGATANRADAVLTDQGWAARGDPTEAALVVAARKAGLERAALVRDEPEVGEVPFSSERKLMVTFHRGEQGRTVAYLKGSPQRVLSMCRSARVNGRLRAMDEADRASVLSANHLMATRGLRVLAVATGPVRRADEADVDGLTFVALIGLSDPPAPGVQEAIEAFRLAGVRTVMITGDQRETAVAVATELGLADGTVASLDGREADALSDQGLAERVPGTAIFSRISPEAKLRIVGAFQARGEIVAMIGDGVNDAAALKKANVGVAMGRRGTDVARETAAVVLQDDRFDTIGAAIEEGRVVFDNIRKFVFFLFSCNLAEILVLLGASAAGWPLPLLPIQVLWLNLLTDTFPALALALEPAQPDVMRRPPRDPKAELLSAPFLRSIAAYAALMAGATMLVVAWGAQAGAPPERAMTMNFMALSFAQLLHLGNARDAKAVLRPARALANRAALGAVALGAALQVAAVAVPVLRELLHTVALGPEEWLVVGVASLIPAVAGQTYKLWRGVHP